MLYLLVICAICCLTQQGLAQTTRVYNFTVGWTTANPDGRHERRVMGVNGVWPPPTIEADVGDRVVVRVYNNLTDQSTGLHFHGLFQNGTTHMDGAVGVTQCGIPPGLAMTYNFTVDQPGTYWYHSHEPAQYPDGLRAPLIIHDPANPFVFDDELVLSLSDWYHGEMRQVLRGFLDLTNPTGAEPGAHTFSVLTT